MAGFSKQSIGARGEDLSSEYLQARGFHIMERNYRFGRYELDIIAFKDGVLHFVEVKTRQKGAISSPEDAMTEAKFKSLLKAAKYYIEQNAMDYELQFDLIAVEYNGGECEIRYIPEVMSPRW